MEATAAPTAPVMPEKPGRRQLLLGVGHIAGLWAITFAQPLLSLLGKNPDFFVARGNSVGDILLLAFGMVIVPPVIMGVIEFIALKINAGLYKIVHFLFIAGIASFLFFQFQKNTGWPTFMILVIGIGLALLFAWALFRSPFLKNLMDILIVAPIVVLVMFIFFSNAHDLIFPKPSEIRLADSSKAHTPVVLIIFDELGTNALMTNDKTIDAQRYPNFAKLSHSSTWYRNESTTAFFTPRAVPGILTGKRAANDALPTSEDQPNSIFSLLGKTYKLHVLEPVTDICPDSLCPADAPSERQLNRLKDLGSDLKYVEGRLVLPPGIANTLPDVGTNFQGFGQNSSGGDDTNAPPTLKDKLFVKGRGNDGDPAIYDQFIKTFPTQDKSLVMMHLHLPHQPWKYDVQGKQFNSGPLEQLSRSTGPWLVDNDGVQTTQARMYTQTGYADTLVGVIRRKLEAEGMWNKSMVIFTADHGVSFQGQPVPQRQADDAAMGTVANPPLFIKYPGQKKGVVTDKHSMTLDIVPTIAKQLGITPNYKPQGVPLQGPVPKRPVKVTDINGKVYQVPLPTMVKQRNQSIATTNKRLGTGPIYTLGPAPDLLGQPAPAVPSSASGASLDSESMYDGYVPDKDLIPMFITGTTDNIPEGSLIAVGVNGKIRGTAKTFNFQGADRFGAVVDPASLHAGDNKITVYKVVGGNLIPIGSNQ